MEIIIKYMVFAVSTCLTYALGILSKKHKWNDAIPIPIQNVIVGLIVFALSYVFCKFTKKDIDPEFLLNQIVLAIGGSGLATLSYDIKKSKKE